MLWRFLGGWLVVAILGAWYWSRLKQVERLAAHNGRLKRMERRVRYLKYGGVIQRRGLHVEGKTVEGVAENVVRDRRFFVTAPSGDWR